MRIWMTWCMMMMLGTGCMMIVMTMVLARWWGWGECRWWRWVVNDNGHTRQPPATSNYDREFWGRTSNNDEPPDGYIGVGFFTADRIREPHEVDYLTVQWNGTLLCLLAKTITADFKQHSIKTIEFGHQLVLEPTQTSVTYNLLPRHCIDSLRQKNGIWSPGLPEGTTYGRSPNSSLGAQPWQMRKATRRFVSYATWRCQLYQFDVRGPFLLKNFMSLDDGVHSSGNWWFSASRKSCWDVWVFTCWAQRWPLKFWLVRFSQIAIKLKWAQKNPSHSATLDSWLRCRMA